MDFAELVAPEQVIGIDIETAQIEKAKMLKEARKLTNVKFQVDDLNDLPFNDNTFEAIFTHGVIEYFQDPVHAFREIRRVLKKGGVFGTRHGDWGGFLLATKNAYTKKAFSLFVQLMQRNGGDPFFGRNQVSYLRQSGFTRIIANPCRLHHTIVGLRVLKLPFNYFRIGAGSPYFDHSLRSLCCAKIA
ncbi:2-methoxy-6-polyprenyl-1,4-benzoquinol methylase [subsurface metagenome]